MRHQPIRNQPLRNLQPRLVSVLSIIAIAALLIGFTSLTAGCNTWKGAGKDVERTGEAMQGE